MKKFLIRLNAILFAFLFLQGNVQALSGPWVDMPNAQARLIVSGDPMSGNLLAGLEIELDEGWKTYWRSPGDSGIPPQLSWQGSDNIAKVQIMYPAPKRFSDDYGQSIGYKDRVIFPIALELTSAGRPSTLVLDAFLGICREVCIPVKEKLELKIPPLFSTKINISDALSRAKTSLPAIVPDQLKASFNVVPGSEKVPLLEITIPSIISYGGMENSVLDIFIEGPENWFLTLPNKVSQSATHQSWQLPLYGIPRNETPWGVKMLLTIVSKDISYEQAFTMDAPL